MNAPGVSAQAPAKLNLYLHVHGRREDGYHIIESAVVFTALADMLHATLADSLSLTTEGEFADAAGGGEGNLVLKAVRLLQEKTGCTKGASLRLVKNIPVGAGLGGGSADAAAALKLLNKLWSLDLSMNELHALAPTLGADVAMCLDSTPAIACGIGEELVPLAVKLPVLHAVLVHPRTPLLTADVYAALRREPLREHKPDALSFASSEPSMAQVMEALSRTHNDLQRPAITVSSTLAETLLALETALPSASLVRMTGSGACCFALYASRDDAESAAKKIRRDYPNWWVVTTDILS